MYGLPGLQVIYFDQCQLSIAKPFHVLPDDIICYARSKLTTNV